MPRQPKPIPVKQTVPVPEPVPEKSLPVIRSTGFIMNARNSELTPEEIEYKRIYRRKYTQKYRKQPEESDEDDPKSIILEKQRLSVKINKIDREISDVSEYLEKLEQERDDIANRIKTLFKPQEPVKQPVKPVIKRR